MKGRKYNKDGASENELLNAVTYQGSDMYNSYAEPDLANGSERDLLQPRAVRKEGIFRRATVSEAKSELLHPSNLFIITSFLICLLLTWRPMKNKLSVYAALERNSKFHVDPLVYAPAIVIPVSAKRGLRLLDAIESFDYPVEHLIIHDNSEGEGSVSCAIARIQKNFQEGRYHNINNFSVILSQGTNAGASFSWNSLASFAFDTLQLPWIFISNDDLSLLPGALKSASDAMWQRYRDHSLVLSNSGLPGIGNAFSFFGISILTYRHLGSFDENFWPAYHEDCDYLARAVAAGVPWYKNPDLDFIHPIPGSPPDEEMKQCMEEKERMHSHRRESTRVGPRDAILVAEGAEDHGYTNRNYFFRKWGSTCDSDIFFRYPFNNPRNPVSFWAFDEARRLKIKSLFKPGVMP